MKHLFLICAALLLLAGVASAREDQLIAILESDATLHEKHAACRELVHVGTGQAVPALARLLADEELYHMARYALEPIPDPSVDRAMRDALGALEGRMLANVIDGLGVRRDPEAIAPIARFLTDADPAVARAAAGALGDIGGAAAAQALEAALPDSKPPHQDFLCEGLLRCAENMADGEAVVLYDKLRAMPDLPPLVKRAALRGAILSRGAPGMALWVEAARSESPQTLVDAMGISMDIPGPEMTQALAQELAQADPQKRLLLVETLGHRGDGAAAPALTPLAQTGPAGQRVAAIRSLAQLGAPSAIPVLVALAQDSEAPVATAARSGLIGFPGREVDGAVMGLLDAPDAGRRLAAVEILGQRRVAEAVPSLLKATGDGDSAVVNASFKTLGELAGPEEIPALIEAMMKTGAVAPAESALSAICSRQSDAAMCSEKIIPGLADAKGAPRQALLRVLGAVGDARALAAVREAASDADESVRDTALRALCAWPTVEALPDLMKIAESAGETTYRILAVRGMLRLIPAQEADDAQKIAQLKEALQWIERPEEQRLVLAILAELPSADALALAMAYTLQPALRDEANLAAVGIAEKIVATHPAEVARAMGQIQTDNEELAGRVRELLSDASM